MKFWCCKCKKEIEAEKREETKTKKGLRIAKSICPICETKVARILGK